MNPYEQNKYLKCLEEALYEVEKYLESSEDAAAAVEPDKGLGRLSRWRQCKTSNSSWK
jgi:hypothetical protein